MYWSTEPEELTEQITSYLRLAIRTTYRNGIDDSNKMIQAIDGDNRFIASSHRHSAIVITTLDDRVALTIERVKAEECVDYGCATKMDGPNLRIQQNVDEFRLSRSTREVGASSSSAENVDSFPSTVTQWMAEVQKEQQNETNLQTEQQAGLPKQIDSRLVFI